MSTPSPNDLSPEGCLKRQARLREKLAALSLDAALLTWRHHVYYFTGHWGFTWHVPLLLVPVDGPVRLVTGGPPDEVAAIDAADEYVSNYIATLVDNQAGETLKVMLPHLKAYKRIGCDEGMRPWMLADLDVVDLNPALYELRLIKDADEVACIRRSIAGADAAYACAKAMIEPGVTEVQLHAAMHAAAINAVGEPIDPFGNDFQSNSPGGPPRDRPVQDGELAIFDLGVQVRAYRCDLSRAFAVNGKPTDAQLDAHARVVAALDYVEKTVKPGVSCKMLYEDVTAMIDGHHGWKFTHHLGHGIGVWVHESPRLNPNYDDTFAQGNVFTAEPGLYGKDLKAGIRLEQDYVVTANGVERLSHFPLGL